MAATQSAYLYCIFLQELLKKKKLTGKKQKTN